MPKRKLRVAVPVEPVVEAPVNVEPTQEKGDVVVSFEGGMKRIYTGKTAKADALNFVSKRPNDRAIV